MKYQCHNERRFLIHTFSALDEAIVKDVPHCKIKGKGNSHHFKVIHGFKHCYRLSCSLFFLFVFAYREIRLKSCVIVTTDSTVVITGNIIVRSTAHEPHSTPRLKDGPCAQMEDPLRLWPTKTSAGGRNVT
ncbi:hypothetical protein FOYG_16806 [Fusarium oxysporum NRRL 32931]|uniref:Uncharacterized protein n=1 Tax=Fusarium oxysporum NRRL 32931 TaxID=660029 RepID=W9HCQ7_FUSOX|nr:hypothetical protein FOYG_16806 [Fusarium oxysporum NRRL 32931]